jgi:Uma2 family endonuclease
MNIDRLPKHPISAASPISATRLAELSGGTLLEKPLEGLAHGALTARLARLVGNYVEAWRLGETTGADTGYLLAQDGSGPQLVYAPDIAFISARRLAQHNPHDFYVRDAPDLAIEVISSADSARAIEARVLAYLRAGSSQVWVVYPESQTVLVHTPERVNRLGLTDTLTGSDILPGFSIAVALLFAPLPPLITRR